MCGDCCPPTGLSRRRFMLAAGVGALAIPAVAVVPAAASVVLQTSDASLDIAPRSVWGSDLPPTGPIASEDDVRLLLVHHTAGTNSYAADEVPGILRGIYGFHTSPQKGWPDVAYNFFVDRHGGVWEGREGSLAGPVQGDATGGSQGFAQLCCFLGDHSLESPTAEAVAAMTSVLAWLADRHAIDTHPGARTDFVSRGSNLHAAGTEVTTATIAGHRDMSATACPGDFAYDLVQNAIPAEVTALRSADPAMSSTVTTAAPPSSEPAPPSTSPPVPVTENVLSDEVTLPAPAGESASGETCPVWLAAGLAGILAAAVAGGIAHLRRRVGGHRATHVDDGEGPA